MESRPDPREEALRYKNHLQAALAQRAFPTKESPILAWIADGSESSPSARFDRWLEAHPKRVDETSEAALDTVLRELGIKPTLH